MLALGGLRAGFGRGAGAGFKEVAEMSCKEGFRKNETEVVHGGSKETMNGTIWSGERLLREFFLPPFSSLSHAEPLKQSELGSHRFRIVDYRVVFGLEGQEIVVLRIGHRRVIYKR